MKPTQSPNTQPKECDYCKETHENIHTNPDCKCSKYCQPHSPFGKVFYNSPQSKEVEWEDIFRKWLMDELEPYFQGIYGTMDGMLEMFCDQSIEKVTNLLSSTRQQVQKEMVEIENKYQELIMAVGNKYSGETRHQTALRYIKNAESRDLSTAKETTK
jgi:hypothetical protein